MSGTSCIYTVHYDFFNLLNVDFKIGISIIRFVCILLSKTATLQKTSGKFRKIGHVFNKMNSAECTQM